MYSKNSNWIDSLNRSAGSRPSKTTRRVPGRSADRRTRPQQRRIRDRSAFHSCHCVGLEVGPGHAAARAIEGVKVIADRASEVPGAFEIRVRRQRDIRAGPSRRGARHRRRDSGNHRGWSSRRERRGVPRRSSRRWPSAARAASCPPRSPRPPRSTCPGAALRRARGRALRSQKPA